METSQRHAAFVAAVKEADKNPNDDEQRKAIAQKMAANLAVNSPKRDEVAAQERKLNEVADFISALDKLPAKDLLALEPALGSLLSAASAVADAACLVERKLGSRDILDYRSTTLSFERADKGSSGGLPPPRSGRNAPHRS